MAKRLTKQHAFERLTEAASDRSGWPGRRLTDVTRSLGVVRGGRRRSDHALSPASMVAAGFVGGLALGAMAWSHLLEGSRRGLFSPSPVRRYAAVSYLGARPSVDTARLLRDYVRWEPLPLLRRRARRVLAAVESSLGT